MAFKPRGRLSLAALVAPWLLLAPASRAWGQFTSLSPSSARHDFSAPYDLRWNPKLSQDELEFILSSASGGPYRARGNSLERVDAGGKGRALSSSEVFDLLRARSSAVVRKLRAAGDSRLTPRQRSQAERILRQRYMLLDAEDRRWLEKRFALRYGSVPSGKMRVSPAVFTRPASGTAARVSTVGWGLGRRRAGQNYYPKPANSQAAKAVPAPKSAASKPVEPLDPVARLRKDLGATFKSFPGGEEKTALSKALDLMMKSPTARKLAQELVDQKVSVNFSFEDIPHSRIIQSRGRKVITGSPGHTNVSGSYINVFLNRQLIEISPDAGEIAVFLSHELLGHGRQTINAQKKGLSRAYDIWDQNEVNAGLVEWAVRAELGLPLANGHLWNYLRSPTDYPKTLKTNLSYYAGTFSREEMGQDVVKLLKDRKVAAQKAKKDLDNLTQKYQGWKKVVDHFVQDPAHREPDSRFAHIRETADNQLNAYVPDRRETLDEIGPYLDQRIAYFQSRAGMSERNAVRGDMDKAFFKGVEAENSRLHQTLQAFAQGKSFEGELPPLPAGQLSQKEFQELYEKDKESHPQMDQ